MHAVFPRLSAPALGAVTLCGLLLSSHAALAAPCEVRLAGLGNADWQRAVDALGARLADQSDGDCASIVVSVDGGAARVLYTTRDGRTAERTLANPEELRPTVEALLITGSAGAPPGEAPHASPAAQERTAPAPAVVVVKSPPPAPHPIFGVGAGARVGDHKLATPLMEVAGSLAITDWELAVLGRWEPGYHALDDNPEGRRSSGFSAGVAIGRRDPLSSGIAVLWGADVMLASLDDDSSERLQQGHVGHAEARVGGYVGAVVPRDSSPRFRATLGADVLPTQIGSPEKDPAGQPLTPWIAATLVLGMEIGTP